MDAVAGIRPERANHDPNNRHPNLGDEMKRAIAVALALGLLGGAMVAPAEAGKKKKKKKPAPYTLEVAYDNPAIGVLGAGVSFGGPSIASNATNVYMSVEIIDDISPTAHGEFSWDTDGDGINDTGVTVCGKTDEPVKVPANQTMVGFMWLAPSPDCPGSSTSGIVKATFSATP